MKRVTQFNFYSLGYVRSLEFLRAGDKLAGHRVGLNMCGLRLGAFCRNELNQRLLPNAVREATFLRNTVRMLSDPTPTEVYVNPNGELTQEAEDIIAREVVEFETALRHGLDGLPTYVVERVGIYDADYLLTKADDAFPADLRPYIPAKSLDDFKKAGSCLAFELYTASGFHGFRALDEALRAYCTHFTGGLPKQGDWGSFIREIRSVPVGSARMPNTRTVDLIDRIRAEDRNPLIHPETDLDALQANTTFDLCRTAITFMAMDIKAAP